MAIVIKAGKRRASTDQNENAPRETSQQRALSSARDEPAASLEPLLPVRAAACFLGMSTAWLNKSRLTGSGPSYCRIGRRVLYHMPDLLSWIEKQKKEHTRQYAAPVR